MYKKFIGNPYHRLEYLDVICATTNGTIRRDGKAVMGRGSAKFVRDTFEGSDAVLGKFLKKYGNRAYVLGLTRYNGVSFYLASFPTKDDWAEDSKLEIIENSAKQIKEIADIFGFKRIYIPIPGCGNGQLVWSQVRDSLRVLDDRFIIYSLREEDFNN